MSTPPENKRSFVSEKLDIKAVADEARKEMDKPDFIPDTQVLLLFTVEKLHDISVAVNSLVEIFKSGAINTTLSQTTTAPKLTPQITPPKATVTPAPTPAPVKAVAPVDGESPRLTEVKTALAEFLEKLKFDEASSAQFIIIRPIGFLGGGNFPKIAGVIKNTLGGEYVSQGKDSHFKVPKLKQ